MNIPAQEIKKIAIFRALQLGDMLCAIPAIRALRNAYPHAEITLLGLPWAKTLTARFPDYIDRFIHFPGYPGLPEQEFDSKAFLAFLACVQEEQFDLVLQMQGNGSIVNPMVELFGAKYTAGFCLPDDYYPDNGLFLQYPEGIHETERHLKLMEHLGIKSFGLDMEFPLFDKDYEEYKQAKLPIQPNRYVCIHPGSRGAWRQWPPRYFAMLADHCKENGLDIVITGTKEEMPIVNEVVDAMQYDAIIAAGKTTMGAVGVLIKNAALLISNCTGVSHIAAALKKPSIIISMDGAPERWAPINKDLHRTTDWTKTPDFDMVFNDLKDLLNTLLQTDHLRNKLSITR